MEKKIIQKIRDDYSSQNNTERTLNGYAQSIKILAEDLYAKDTHFIFELIQNAEDNDYKTEIPLLRFVLSNNTDSLFGQKYTTALIVENNETGFQQKHVESICGVGLSTKTKTQGYIGEKGIGFKSVFRVTSCPYIFSNGYYFALPEKDNLSGLGYIVPSWIDSPPINLNKKITSIFLPLDKPDFPIDRIIKSLQDIAPETILFLNKLKAIEVKVTLEEYFEIIIKKDDSRFPLVKLTYLKKNDIDETIAEQLFWVASKKFDKPDNINHEKRAHVESRQVSVAIPLDGEQQGKLFAYLPVWENIGLPFLINADFLLVSSREGVKESEPWNLWLRECIPEVYADALISCLSSDILPFEQKIKAYASLPLETNQDFLQPIIKLIHQKITITECIFTAPYKSFSKPLKSRIANSSFLRLIGDDSFPEVLRGSIKLVCPELDPFSKALRDFGVSSLKRGEVMECLDDSDWISCKSANWLLDLYRYLIKDKIDDDSLRKKKIMKIETEDEHFLSCDAQQPIYFLCDNEARKAMDDVPDWLKRIVPVAFLDKKFLKLLSEQADSEELKDWMTKRLNVHRFSISRYCVDISNTLTDQYNLLSSKKIAEATSFIVAHSSDHFDWNNLPVALSTGEKSHLTRFNNKKIIVPENYDKNNGWQHIWVTEQDRQNFVILSKDYNSETIDHLLLHCKDKIKKYPDPEKVIKIDLSSSNDYEMGSISKCPYSTSQKTISNWRAPSTLKSETIETKKESDSLLTFLSVNGLQPYMGATVHYSYYRDRKFPVDSEFYSRIRNCKWLPTQKGFVRPAQAFLPRKEIKEILGDTVPYFQGSLPEKTIKFLGIKAELAVDELLETLNSYSNDTKVNPEMVYRIYSVLETRTRFVNPDDIVKAFKKNKIVFIPESKEEGQWYELFQVIWEDSNNVLGDDFICLQKHYPNLKNFFVNTLSVKECADPESFAQRWLKLQDKPVENSKKIREIMEAVYRILLPIAREEKIKRPDWWDGFVGKALILTQNNSFECRSKVVVPDDGELERIFSKTDINFAWRPEKDSFNHWVSFYEAFSVPRLSKSVFTKLSGAARFETKSINEFVTESAIVMLSAWLRERDNNYYSNLLKDGIFQELCDLKEATASEGIKILFTLKTDYLIKEIEEDYPAFWDRQKGQLIINGQAESSNIKTKAAAVIAKGLMINRAYRDLAHWIELIIGAKDIDRIRDYGLSVPEEINKLFSRDDQDLKKAISKDDEKRKGLEDKEPQKDDINVTLKGTEAKGDNIPKKKGSEENNPLGSTKQKHDEKPTNTNGKTENFEESPPGMDYDNKNKSLEVSNEEKTVSNQPIQLLEHLNKAFNRNGATSLSEEFEDENYFNEGRVKNPNRRRERSTIAHKDRIKNEPAQIERYRETIRIMLEPADPATRSYLIDLYAGKCQICGKTFPQRDGSPFFVAGHIVERRHARLLDNYANTLCLCPLHFAQWRHGAVEAEDISEQILSKKTKAEGADDDLSLKITLCGNACNISYKEKHLVALQTLLDALVNTE